VTRRRPIIAIDGPVGAGKSTVAERLAQALGFEYVSTGAMYRGVAIAARAAGLSADDPGCEEKLKALLGRVRIEFAGGKIMLDGRDVSGAIAEPEIGELASRLSTLGAVRARMHELQLAAGAGGGVVMEGRDIGTAVFPDADFKFFLDARAEVRADRRYRELCGRGAAIAREEVLAQLIERDRRDRGRELAPLRPADDAIVIDASDRGIDEVVSIMVECVRTRDGAT
jgi:CMP/dCMP kinase